MAWKMMLMLIVMATSIIINTCGGVSDNFVKVSPTSFMLDGHHFYVNGFNAYWMPSMAIQNKSAISHFLEQARGIGLTVARISAFRNGGHTLNAIQTSPGEYNEQALQGLDYVIHEASRNGISLIMMLANNWADLGGRPQYVKWAQDIGENVTSDDDFYTDPTVKQFYKNYVQMLLTRNNTITGITYKEDPTIFSWELMNEPRSNDSSGDTIQSWISEMSSFVKSIDSNHLLDIGLEGFYNARNPGNVTDDSWSWNYGTDYIRNNLVPEIDFATVHTYSDNWLPNATFEEQVAFARQWITGHIEDAATYLKKPVLFTEFGKSYETAGYEISQRQEFMWAVYSSIYTAAREGLPSGGGLVWQLFADEMDPAVAGDGYEIRISNDTSIIDIIRTQSERITLLNQPIA